MGQSVVHPLGAAAGDGGMTAGSARTGGIPPPPANRFGDNPRADMPNIQRLPDQLVNQIAAGEVIERPAAALRELVENALDAGARIHLDLEEGGVALIRIVDDGCGIPPAEIPLAFASHATSKLSDVADLDHIATLGFRGEALASIASVARCRMFSRVRGTPLGASVEIEGGRLGEIRESGGPEGTRIEVRDLFFNTPARRRFLKATATELGRCLDIVQRLALAQPGVGFVVTHDGRRAFEVEPAMDLRARVRRTFGAELADALAPVEARDGDTVLSGFVAPPRFARNDTTRQMWFLNGRPLRDKILARVLKDAYRGFIVDGRQSVAFLSLSMDPAKVDVNVHPAKAEVRFRDGGLVRGLIVSAIRDALGRKRAPDTGLSRQTVSSFRPVMPRPFNHRGFDEEEKQAALAMNMPPAMAPAAAAPEAPLVDHPLGQARAQIHDNYIVAQTKDGFVLVDQHAAHERLTHEALTAQLREGSVRAQPLLVPAVVDMPQADAARLLGAAEALARLGLEIESFGAGAVLVRSLPALLGAADPAPLLRDMAEELAEDAESTALDRKLDAAIARLACHGSIRAGRRLNAAEMDALLRQMEATPRAATCSHGRPTVLKLDAAALERMFGRR